MEVINKQNQPRVDEEWNSRRLQGRTFRNDYHHNASMLNHSLHCDLKVDLPVFNGENVDDWLFCLEEYFDFVAIPMEQQVKLVSLHMVGPTYSWYKWLVCNDYPNDWFVFFAADQQHFGTYLFENSQEALKELHQSGLVVEY